MQINKRVNAKCIICSHLDEFPLAVLKLNCSTQ